MCEATRKTSETDGTMPSLSQTFSYDSEVHTNYQIATEYKSINGGAFTEHQSFVYATYIDDPIALIGTNGTYFYHSNQQYSVSSITDSNGNLSERYGYNAYGKPVVITDSILVDNPYFFTGRQLDSETGLFYFRARYYDASLGQFISRDPLNYVDGMNLYRGYFAVNALDPMGLDGGATAIAVAVGIGVVTTYYATGCDSGATRVAAYKVGCQLGCKKPCGTIYVAHGQYEGSREEICQRNWLGRGTWYPRIGAGTLSVDKPCNAKCAEGDETLADVLYNQLWD